MRRPLPRPCHRRCVLLATALCAISCWLAVAPNHAQAGPLLDLFHYFSAQLRPTPERAERPRDADEAQRPRAGLDLGSTAIAARAARLPRLQWTDALTLDEAWTRLKRGVPYAQQLDRVERKGLWWLAAEELEPVTGLRPAFDSVYRRRDRWRERTYARPEMVAVLARAATRAQRELPGVRITLGDVAQPGGGQILYGVKVELKQDDGLRSPIADLLASASWREGAWVQRERVDPAATFGRDYERFTTFERPVLLDRRVVAIEPGPAGGASLQGRTARLETRRYYAGEQRTADEMAGWWTGFQKRWRSAAVVRDEAEDRDGARVRRAALLKGRDLVELWLRDGKEPALATRGRKLAWPELNRVLEVQISSLDAKKPGVRMRPSRWLREEVAHNAPPRGDSGPTQTGRWQQWRLLYEATHISHMNGLDADISYVTDTPGAHFSKEIHRIDAERSLIWIRILTESARDVGVRVDKILVDPKVIAKLKAALPEDEPEPEFWALIAAAKGHDSHLHLRLAPGFGGVAGPLDDAPPLTPNATPTRQ